MRSWTHTTSIVLVWQCTASLGFYGVFAAIQFVPETFAVSGLFVGFVVTALMLGYTVGLFPAGALVDGYGERPVLIGGLVGLALVGFAVAGAQSYLVLLVVLFAFGGVYATAMPGTNRAIVTHIPTERRSLAMNIKQVGVTAGSSAGALLITYFATTRFGWQGGFVAAAVLGLVVVAVFAVSYRGTTGTASLRLPNLELLLENRQYVALVVAGTFLGAALFTTTGYTTLYVSESVGASAAFAGLTLAVMQIAGSAGRLTAGTIADFLPQNPARANATVLLGQAALAGVLLVAITFVQTRLEVLVGFALLGFTALGFTGVYYACLGELVPNEQVGTATAGGQTALNAGALFAPPVFGFLVDRTTYAVGWDLLAVCMLVAFVILALLVRDDGKG